MTHSRSTAYHDDPDAEDLAADQESRAPAWARRHLGMLVDLGDMGMVLARDLVRRAAAETEAAEAAAEAGEPAPRPGPVIDPALSFTRISRAVRLTIALEARMRREIEAGVFGVANDDGPGRGGVAGRIDYEGISRQYASHVHTIIHGEQDHEVRRAVEETIEATYDDLDDVERLREELKERLEEDEVFEDRNFWPTGEVIALICQDLGLTPDWDRWRSRGWARKEAEESPVGSPYATDPTPPPLNNPFPQGGTGQYREARGLPPLEGPPPLRARGPPS
jgi:hypothetical protein